MKKLLTLVAFLSLGVVTNAQITTPQPSLANKTEQKVGLTDVTLEFSRPNMRGRKIFGDLVPFGKVWRTGANANTKFTSSTSFTVGGKELAAGTYAIYSIPAEKSWDVIFYSDASNWGNPREWDEAKVAAKVNVPVYNMPVPIESFTITLDDLSANGASIGILWENTYVGVPFTVPTDAAVTASIEKTMSSGKATANDFYAAAVYYKEAGKDINKAVKWINKCIELNKDKPKFWQYRQQSLILAKSGDKKGAISAAKASLELATKAGNADYVKMNKDSLKEWGAK